MDQKKYLNLCCQLDDRLAYKTLIDCHDGQLSQVINLQLSIVPHYNILPASSAELLLKTNWILPTPPPKIISGS